MCCQFVGYKIGQNVAMPWNSFRNEITVRTTFDEKRIAISTKPRAIFVFAVRHWNTQTELCFPSGLPNEQFAFGYRYCLSV